MSAWLARIAAPALGGYLRRRNRQKLVVLMYHGVVESELEPFCWHQLPLETFRRQMAWVAKNYRVLPLDEALRLRAEGRLPERSCAITFDDGYENVATSALPVLQGLGLPATVFLVTDLLGTDGVPWPDRLWLAVRATTSEDVDAGALGLGTRTLATNAEKAALLETAFDRLKAQPRAAKEEILDALVAALDVPEPIDPGPFRVLAWDRVEGLAKEGLLAFGPHSTTHEILSRCEDDVSNRFQEHRSS